MFCSSYDASIVSAIKTVSGRRWDSQQRLWIIPDISISRQKLLEELYNTGLFTADLPEKTELSSTDIEKQKDDLLLKSEQALIAHHYSPRTLDAYIHWIQVFFQFHNDKSNSQLTKNDINSFLSHLALEETDRKSVV